MKYELTFIFCLLCISVTAQKGQHKAKLPIELINFFEGSWVGEGAFANGEKIEADLSFKLTLDSCWLTYSHTDKSPNRYKATSMWGTDKPTGKVLAYVFDNFNGHRMFTSDGWKADSLVLTYRDVSSAASSYQKCTYKKTDADKFKMSYEVSNDSITWKLGDWLIFRRISN